MDHRSRVPAGAEAGAEAAAAEAATAPSRILGRAATLTARDCRALYRAARRVELGSFRRRLAWGFGHRYEPYRGPMTTAWDAAGDAVGPAVRDLLQGKAEAALRRAAGGTVAAPGDPGPLRARLRFGALFGSWIAVFVLLGLLALRPWDGVSRVAQALGVMILVAEAVTLWLVLVPTRATTVVRAVAGAACAELFGDLLPDAAAAVLERPWAEAIAHTGRPDRDPLIDRIASTTMTWGVMAFLTGIGVALLPGERFGISTPAAILLFGGLGLAMAGLGISALASVGRFLAAWPAPPSGGALEDAQRGTPLFRSLAAAVLGGVIFGVGDATTGVVGWVVFGAAIAAAVLLGWWSARPWPVLGYAVGGLIGTWLSVELRIAGSVGLDLGRELLSSGFVAVIAGVPGLAAAWIRAFLLTETVPRSRPRSSPPRDA